MIDEQTIQKLCDLKLNAMATAVRELLTMAPGKGMSFEEKLGLVVEREWTDRENRRLARRLKEAKLGMSACLEDVWCEPGRGLDKDVVRSLATCQWVRAKQNVITIGATGVGKSFLKAALAQAACRNELPCTMHARPAISSPSSAISAGPAGNPTRSSLLSWPGPRCLSSTTSSSRLSKTQGGATCWRSSMTVTTDRRP